MECYHFTYIFFVVLLVFADLINCSFISTFPNDDYDKSMRPDFEKDNPVTIESSLHIEAFGNIEEANMEYKVFGYFRQYWNDSRLAGKLNRTLTLKGSDIDKVWVPDPFCYNARESNLMTPNEEVNSKLHIDTNGNMAYSKGIILLASCAMDLKHYPLDKQQCHLKFGSYAYTSKDIIYHWRSTSTTAEVKVGHDEMAQFTYKGSILTEDIEHFPPDTFSTITATFYFERRIGYALIQIYFPDIFVVMLSWIVFWMEIDAIGDRMALGIATVLTIMFLLGSLNGNLPKVSYPKALDWYLLVSFLFVFLSLIEAVIVFIICEKAKSYQEKTIRYKKKGSAPWKRITSSVNTCIFGKGTHLQTPDSYNPKDRKILPEDDIEMNNTATGANKVVVDEEIVDPASNRSKQVMKRAELIDTASRYLFPLSFAAYNIYYWRQYYL